MRARQGSKRAKAAITAEMPRRVPMLAITDGAIDARLILGLGAAAENDLAARPSHHDGEEDHEHDDFASVVIDLPEVTDIDALVASVQRLAREQNVLRVKGYIAVEGKPMRLLLQAVGERVRHQFDKPWGAGARQSKLVVIGEHGDIDEAAIKADLVFQDLVSDARRLPREPRSRGDRDTKGHRPGPGRSRGALVFGFRSCRVRGRLAPWPRQPAVAAARQSRRTPSSALGRHLYRAHAVRRRAASWCV